LLLQLILYPLTFTTDLCTILMFAGC